MLWVHITFLRIRIRIQPKTSMQIRPQLEVHALSELRLLKVEENISEYY
jgi:hypothetical protein